MKLPNPNEPKQSKQGEEEEDPVKPVFSSKSIHAVFLRQTN